MDRESKRTGEKNDISSAKKYLGYNPQVKMIEGLKITLEWFKQAFHSH